MRGKRRTRRGIDGRVITVALVLAAILLYLLTTADGQLTLVCLLVGIGAFLLLRRLLKEDRLLAWTQPFHVLSRDDVDNMPGPTFESYVAKLMEHHGYTTQVTPESEHVGVDLIAQKEGETYAVQCKHHSTLVSRNAISEAVAGKPHYGCSKAMVVTNRFFMPGAKDLARSTNCLLVDRDLLAVWADSYHRTTTVPRGWKTYTVPGVLCGVILLSLCGASVGLVRLLVPTSSSTGAGVQAGEWPPQATATATAASPQMVVTIFAEAAMPPVSIPTATPGTPQANGPRVAMAPGDTPVNVRRGPGADFASIGMLRPGDSTPITGKSPDGRWWRIRYKGQPGWVSVSVAPVRGDTAVVVTVP